MSYKVTLAPFDVEFSCEENDTILEAAFKAGVALRHGCKHGGCGACKVKVLDGCVEHNDHATAISEAEIDEDIALLCCSLPEEDVVIELNDDYTLEELTPEFPVAEHPLTLAELTWVTHDIAHLVLTLPEGECFGFRAGQYLEISLRGDENFRSFSMANISTDGGVELLIKLMPNGHFSRYLKDQACAGDALTIRGPFGQFGISDTEAPMVMIAGGSGMAPIMSMLRQLKDEKSTRPIQFFYGARSQEDLFWVDQIKSFSLDLPNFEFIPALSEEPSDSGWQGEKGLITDVVARRTVESLRGSEGYLCGPQGMIDAAVDVLKSKGMFSARIRFDKFLISAD
ncbi:2Fe-2S iron-sulfur cluster binding domain-containing protein [Aestuariicella hydrocarbonica]|uniref:2Fe-2S iron-sulfur cluster binding domain-containing protein n=1 Tax=Pseudomaricurvus hydrocarbonicus TaxID=1470433 RepID=A0A9E5JUF3_9GAMM|nr:2Fe-2S iron-sulfur cluster binding domain-containing protein [Aestuariicella hydrocarbonica]NHO64751.1 2Fe-2S iron-sulfur cluster binding domain-containing protein [Aestuariicella hydrocarbonica]